MGEQEWWAEQFEQNRSHLRAVAYRILGSVSEADDAVQEAWLRLSRSEAATIENLGGWLTTVVARVCVDKLRSHAARREEVLEAGPFEPRTERAGDPEHDAMLADSVGLALLVVLDRLTPAERVAFILHDMFDVSFEEIASVVGRSPAAARQLASRARRRVRGAPTPARAEIDRQREVVEAFLAALRVGNFAGLIAVLDPEVVVRIDEAAARPGAPREIRGAENWAKGAITFAQLGRFAEPMIIDGAVGLVWAPGGRLSRALRFNIASGKIVHVEIIADPERLNGLDLNVLDPNVV
jgi:RNA polymerase sigma factor (sigma-70 family)